MTSSPAERDFHIDPAQYDAMVNWQRRLSREEPFYRALFARVGVRRLLDVACGTGRHAAMFHSWDIAVEGADVSPHMLAHCRAQWGESETLRWVERSYDVPSEPAAAFDAALCVGNSLAAIDDPKRAASVIDAMLKSVRPGGVAVVHLLNLWQLEEGPTVWQKCLRATLDGQSRIILKGIHRSGTKAFIDTVSLSGDGAAEDHFRSATLTGFEANDLIDAARQSGASQTDVFGDYEQNPYEREQSQDIILIATRGD
jgi:SAM-dependent methyltransferase